MGMKIFLRIGICAIVILGAGAAAWFVFPGFGKIIKHDQELASQIETRERALHELERSTTGIDDINNKIKDLQAAITFFESKLPAKKEVDGIVDQVWKIAQANSLQTRTIKNGKEEHTANYSEQQIEISLAGDFNGFYLFVQQLEKLPRLTRVSDMTLTKVSERDGEMAAKLTLVIYFEPSGDNGSTATASTN